MLGHGLLQNLYWKRSKVKIHAVSCIFGGVIAWDGLTSHSVRKCIAIGCTTTKEAAFSYKPAPNFSLGSLPFALILVYSFPVPGSTDLSLPIPWTQWLERSSGPGCCWFATTPQEPRSVLCPSDLVQFIWCSVYVYIYQYISDPTAQKQRQTIALLPFSTSYASHPIHSDRNLIEISIT